MDNKVKDEDGAVRNASVPGPGYNNDEGYEKEAGQTAPDRTPSGKPVGKQNEDSREADRDGE
jgi:hypothetical protein